VRRGTRNRLLLFKNAIHGQHQNASWKIRNSELDIGASAGDQSAKSLFGLVGATVRTCDPLLTMLCVFFQRIAWSELAAIHLNIA
jgi:hypothetical protein